MNLTRTALATPLGRAMVGLVALAAVMLSPVAQAFSLEDVTRLARERAHQAYEAPASNLPPVFRQMQFGDYIKIRPKADRFTWRDLDTPFRLAFYHQGMQFDAPVRIHEIVDGEVRDLGYDPADFDFGDLTFDADSTRHLGYAGFRVLFPINRDDKHDEIMSVLGASYFRVIGQDQIYGLSGRGLAIETALPEPEEFPDFREFWIERPEPGERFLVFYALLDSPRATGAFKITLHPGRDAVLDVESRIFLRAPVRKLGIAPLTSMFLYGPHQPAAAPNFRPAIHDSNGLAIHTGDGEWLWRPLHNPPHLNVTRFPLENPKGFGLLQRGHAFARYQDLEDRYDLRPSAWIEPRGQWGKGVVELVEIPTPDETNDNIVAFWSPERMPALREMQTYDYRVHWTLNEPALLPPRLAYVDQVMRSTGEVRQANLIRQPDGSVSLLADFTGPGLAALPDGVTPTLALQLDGPAKIIEQQMQRHPALPGWRAVVRLQVADTTQPVTVRAHLTHVGKALSETWNHQLPADILTSHPGGVRE